MTWVGSIGAWKTTEDAFLRKHYNEQGAKFCSEKLAGRTKSAVHARARVIGIQTPRSLMMANVPQQIDDAIRRAYNGERPHGFSKACADRLGVKPRWVSERAVALGLVAGRSGSHWSEAELAFIEANPMMPPAQVAKSMRRRGWHRTPTAVAFQRLHGKVSTEDPAFFSGAGLAMAMGVDQKTVSGWIRKGLLIAKPRGTQRTDAQGGDTFIIHERDVARFVVENPGSINLAKLEPNKAWFIDLMARCAASTSEGVRDKGQRIYALANARPDLSHAQIADMTGSTQKAVSVTISKLRTAERQRVAA